ncbi:hypothetical protein [Rhizobium sp. BR 249]|uniref:hypothetical protein n=1 Tax=Rhizobium sp. BR 249 TaxID=3040011 RepID=UPI0039BFC002
MNVPAIPTTVVARPYYPLQTVRSVGPVVFRNQVARDYACLLDVDDDVVEWHCLPQIHYTDKVREADFHVTRTDGSVVVDVVTADGNPPPWTRIPVGYRHELVVAADIPAIRLRNARDLLRYASYRVTLSDRVRLLAALDDQGSLSVAECLSIFMDTRPIAGLAQLVLSRFVEIDLDTALIGPETQVRRKRD